MGKNLAATRNTGEWKTASLFLDPLAASGRRVPVAALAPWVERRSEELRGWLERPALWSEPCRSANDRMGNELVGSVLDRLGEIRFRRRSAELRRALSRQHDADEVLYQALLEALGYGGNREPFRLLALRLPWLQLQRTLLALPPERRRGRRFGSVVRGWSGVVPGVAVGDHV